MPRSGSHEQIRWTGHPAWNEYVFLWFFVVIFGVRAGLAVWIGEWGMAIILGAGMALSVALAVFFRHTTRYTVTQDAVRQTCKKDWTQTVRYARTGSW